MNLLSLTLTKLWNCIMSIFCRLKMQKVLLLFFGNYQKFCSWPFMLKCLTTQNYSFRLNTSYVQCVFKQLKLNSDRIERNKKQMIFSHDETKTNKWFILRFLVFFRPNFFNEYLKGMASSYKLTVSMGKRFFFLLEVVNLNCKLVYGWI